MRHDAIVAECEEYQLDETREEFIERMKKAGFIVVEPKSNELFIDIDSDEQYQSFEKNFQVLQREYKSVHVSYDKPSKSGLPRRHIIVQMPWRLRDIERIAWQGALGSDPMRELISCIRLKRDCPKPIIFIEKPEGQ